MPFVLRIKQVESNKGETFIVGELEAGCYFGPEEISVPLKGGRCLNTVVTTMGATSPKGWPMLPEHQSILRLGLHTHVKPSDIAIGEVARGLGISPLPDDDRFRLCNDMLKEPCFWSAHYHEHLDNRELEEEPEQLIPLFFEHDNKQTNDFFLQRLAGREMFPRFTKSLPDQSYVEVSYVEGAEFQIRFSLSLPLDKPILMGYQSGHFSLPAFRWAEIAQICNSHKSVAGSRSAAECLLLLLPSIYICPEDSRAEIQQALKEAWQELEIVRPESIDRLTGNIVSNLTINDHRWSNHQLFGWISNGHYSQRNPESKLSVMPEAAWEKIGSFFSGI